jgi:hypothetical protein
LSVSPSFVITALVHVGASTARPAEDDEVVGIGDDVGSERFAASGHRQYFRNRFM